MSAHLHPRGLDLKKPLSRPGSPERDRSDNSYNEKSESDVSSAEEDGVISITPPSPPTQGAGTTLQPPDRRLVHLAHLAHLEPDFRGSTTVHQAVHFYPNLWRNGAAAEPLGHRAAGR